VEESTSPYYICNKGEYKVGKQVVNTKSKNPFENAVIDEGWEVIEIKHGVKQIIIEEEEVKDDKTSSNRNLSK